MSSGLSRPVGNWLLDALSDEDYGRLLDDLRPVSFSLGEVIYDQADRWTMPISRLREWGQYRNMVASGRRRVADKKSGHESLTRRSLPRLGTDLIYRTLLSWYLLRLPLPPAFQRMYVATQTSSTISCYS